MKKILRVLVVSIIFVMTGITTPSTACDAGDVYVEGTSRFGMCFG